MDPTTSAAAIGAILANIGAALPALVPILYTLVVASLLDLAAGVWAAVASGSFELKYVGEYARSHIALKVGPILLLLLAAVAVGGTDSAGGLALLVSGGTAATLYLAGTVGSIAGNIAAGRTQTKGLPTGVVPTGAVLVDTDDVAPLVRPGDPAAPY